MIICSYLFIKVLKMSRLYQDQDLALKTTTTTTFFVLDESRNQDPKSRDYISASIAFV